MTSSALPLPVPEPQAPTAKRRRKGEGGIEFNKTTELYRGHYRDARGEHVRLPWVTAQRDAEEQLQAALEMMAASDGLSVGAVTLRKWGEEFLEQRELDGHRAATNDANRWKQYVERADFIDWPVESIARRDIKRWLGELKARLTYGRGSPPEKRKTKKPKRPLSWQTRKHALVLLRKAFDVAIDEEKVSEDFANPCFGIKVKRPPTTEKAVNFLSRDEIAKLQKAAKPHLRPLIEFAIATGLRQGEMRALRDEDVHVGADGSYVTVRYGKPPKKPTKSGQPREVPLLPMALRALTEWNALKKTWCSNNFKGLTFPAERGGYRSAGKFLGRDHQEVWKTLLEAANIRRHIVWHDLRHTCATALLGGFFGEKWRLEEIQQLLGHADIETTQMYAHALKETLHDVARRTRGDIRGEKDDDKDDE